MCVCVVAVVLVLACSSSHSLNSISAQRLRLLSLQCKLEMIGPSENYQPRRYDPLCQQTVLVCVSVRLSLPKLPSANDHIPMQINVKHWQAFVWEERDENE